MLQEQIKKDLTDALKSGEQLKRSVLGMVVSAVRNREIEKRTRLSKSGGSDLENLSRLTDEEILEVIASELKKRKESAEQFRAGNRPELAEKEELEIEILKTYLPEQMSEADVRSQIESTIKELGAQGPKDMGKVIGAVMTKLKGRADGGLVSKITKGLLTQ